MRIHSFLTAATVMGAWLACSTITVSPAAAQQTPTYPRDLPPALARQAKISESSASKIARARVPNGRIQGVELERERGALIYSYELKVPHKSGIEEVNVDAKTGRVVSVQHESPASEKSEQAPEQHGKRRTPRDSGSLHRP